MDQSRKQETWISNPLEFLMTDKSMMPDISFDQTALKVTVKLKKSCSDGVGRRSGKMFIGELKREREEKKKEKLK